MKTLSLLIVLVAMFATPALSKSGNHDSVTVLSTKRYVFYFKVEKAFIGATVEVFNTDNVLVHTEAVKQSKNIVDFFYLLPGHYTIKIRKDSEEYSYAYENKE